jgi:putative folate metabolism gamma-glutamate ligase
MQVRAIKTHKITQDRDLFALLGHYLTSFDEGSILAITSKIVSICQGRMVRVEDADKQALIESEADRWLPPTASKYHVSLTIKDHLLIPMAGVDESNANGYYILWPRDAQRVANEVRVYLSDRFSRRQVGVIITDSKTTPLRWGVTGVAVAHSGFLALNDYIGQPDIFGRALQMTKVNVADALAATAVLVMGEGCEQTPLVVIGDLPFVTFQERDPSPEELRGRWIDVEDDLYAPLLQGVVWRKGSNRCLAQSVCSLDRLGDTCRSSASVSSHRQSMSW